MTHDLPIYFVCVDLDCLNCQYIIWHTNFCLKNLYNCTLTSNGWNSPENFLKDCLPGNNLQVGSNKIFHFFLRSTNFFSLTLENSYYPSRVKHHLLYQDFFDFFTPNATNILSTHVNNLPTCQFSNSSLLNLFNISLTCALTQKNGYNSTGNLSETHAKLSVVPSIW